MVRKSSGRMQETTPLIKQRRLIWHQAYGLTFTLTAPNQVVREELEKKVACLKERQKELESIIDAANEMLDML